jgi:hypothetical protein
VVVFGVCKFRGAGDGTRQVRHEHNTNDMDDVHRRPAAQVAPVAREQVIENACECSVAEAMILRQLDKRRWNHLALKARVRRRETQIR